MRLCASRSRLSTRRDRVGVGEDGSAPQVVRAVLDPNVLISAVLSPAGAPALVLRRWIDGDFELIVSDKLLAELSRAFAYRKLRRLVSADDAEAFVSMLRRAAIKVDDPAAARRSRDTGDDYLVALAADNAAFLVTGDKDLLDLSEPAIQLPHAFLEMLLP